MKTLRFALAALAALFLTFGPLTAYAGKVNRVAHTASATLSPGDSSFTTVHTSDGAAATIEITLPDCNVDGNAGNPPYQVKRNGLNTVFFIAATDFPIEVVNEDGVNTVFQINAAAALAAGNEVDLAVGDSAWFFCFEPDAVQVIGNGADGGVAD